MLTNHRRRGLTLAQTAVVAATGGAALLGTGMMITEAELNTLTAESRTNQATVSAGLEAYRVDWGVYPYDGYNYSAGSVAHDYNYWFPPSDLTTPTAYISAEVMFDPFRVFLLDPVNDIHWQWRHMRYTSVESTWGEFWDPLQISAGVSPSLGDAAAEYGGWRLVVVGPDGLYGPTGWPGVSAYPANPIPYDPTNGVESTGDLVATELSPVGYLNIFTTTAVRDHGVWR